MFRICITLFVAAFSFLLSSCKGPANYDKVIHDPLLYCTTVKALNNIVLENNFPPMIAARNYAYANIAAYEVITAGDSSYRSLTLQFDNFPPMPKPVEGKMIDYPLAALLAFVKVGNAVTFPEGSMMAYYEELLKKADKGGMPDYMLENSKEFADQVFNAVLAWAKKDNYSETRSATKYTVSDVEGRWVPTPPAYSPALEAHWMDIRPFVLDSTTECMPARPPVFDMKDKNSTFYKAIMEVKNIGDSLTEEEKHIADFWDDNPFNVTKIGHAEFVTKKFSPPGHWMNIVGIAAKKSGCDFNTTVYAYAKTAIALFDGFISCWDEKYRSNYIRPETVITKYIDPNWRPYIQTPPFPSYPSGHSVISAAAAEVMTEIFGDNFSYTDTSEIEFGINHRSFHSFREAALEASISRLYGGIHFRFDLDEGNKQGRKLGALVVQRLPMRNREIKYIGKK